MNDRQKLARGITRAVLLSGQPEHEIALRIGVNSNSLYRWKRGESRPNAANLLRLADCLGVEAEDLRDGFPNLENAMTTTSSAYQEIT